MEALDVAVGDDVAVAAAVTEVAADGETLAALVVVPVAVPDGVALAEGVELLVARAVGVWAADCDDVSDTRDDVGVPVTGVGAALVEGTLVPVMLAERRLDDAVGDAPREDDSVAVPVRVDVAVSVSDELDVGTGDVVGGTYDQNAP